MTRIRLPLFFALFALLTIALPRATAAMQPSEPASSPPDTSCIVDASSQLLAATPIGDGSQTLVLARVTIAPGGSIGDHTHPGTLAVSIEQGTFGLTFADEGEMTVIRAPEAGGEATQEQIVAGEEATLTAGDGFIETGMVHSARNLGDTDTSVVLSGLVTTGEPLTQCVDAAAQAGSHAG